MCIFYFNFRYQQCQRRKGHRHAVIFVSIDKHRFRNKFFAAIQFVNLAFFNQLNTNFGQLVLQGYNTVGFFDL